MTIYVSQVLTKIHIHGGFFFQAGDGIRDGHVTGVQTCALPICREHAERSPVIREEEAPSAVRRTRGRAGDARARWLRGRRAAAEARSAPARDRDRGPRRAAVDDPAAGRAAALSRRRLPA